jgi:glutamate racemase
MIYLGDTARLPYGTKGSETIIRYALQATERLVERGIKLLVVACNTATAAALPALQKAYKHLPVIGVVEPGARAACAASQNGHILVLATESTIRNQAYVKAIHALRPEATVTGIPCSLFVAMAEEGWMSGSIIEAVAARYLEPVLHRQPEEKPDCLVLGCTHFPPLAPAIRSVVGEEVTMVDSAATTAEAVEHELTRLSLLRPLEDFYPEPSSSLTCFLTTDAPERFARVGGFFNGQPIREESLELVVL